MPGQNTAVFGIFKSPSLVSKAVSRLTSAGFSNSDVSLPRSNIVGLLSGMGIPESESRRYRTQVKEGGILLAVHCSNSLEVDRANTILEQNGAENIFSAGEQAVSTHSFNKP